MKLSDLRAGESGVVIKILGHGAFRKRVMEMGFVKGRTVKVLLYAPLQDPVKYQVMGYEVSLRRSEAHLIEVEPVNTEKAEQYASKPGESNERPSQSGADTHPRHTINVALIGNPNCGKTSLFNIASGSREHVGNYSGVTVDAKSGYFNYKGYHFKIVDLPGTYSLASYSPEELYVRRYLKDETPDVMVNVVDASNLERNLYLTTELIDMDRSMVIALNMYDELRKSGAHLDYATLGSMIGVPMVPVVSKTGEGVDHLFDTIISVYEGSNKDVRHIHVNLDPEMEKMVRVLIDMLKEEPDVDRKFSPRYLAIKLLERDSEAEHIVRAVPGGNAILDERDHILDRYRLNGREDDISSDIASEKYGFIAGA